MAQFLLGLLGAFGLVLGVGTVFIVVYRRHLRRLRLNQRRIDPLAALSQRRSGMPFPPPQRWLAIRSSNSVFLRTLLALEDSTVTWSEALSRSREPALFLSPPHDGWSLVVGGSLPDPAQDIDQCYRLVTRLSREVGEVQFFAADRVLNYHCWARVRDGQVVRAYAWAGETQWNEGRPTLDERLLGLHTRQYGEEPEPPHYGEVSPEQTNSERVFLLARRWGVDPILVSEMIVHQEQIASPDDEHDGAS